MPEYDNITIPQTIPRSTPRPRPRRLDLSHERYPRDGSPEDVFVERRQITRNNYSPKGHLSIRHDEMIRRPRHLSRSADPPKYRDTYRSEDNSSSSEDSDAMYKKSRAVAKRRSDRQLKVTPCSDECADNSHRKSRSQRNTKSRHSSSSSSSSSRSRSSSSDSYSSASENEKRRKHRNRKLLYTGLAAVTTLAAANNIYQNTKAHHARRNQLRDGEMCSSEAKRLKSKALLMDLATVGVVAVGINNARMGWKRVEAVKKEGK